MPVVPITPCYPRCWPCNACCGWNSGTKDFKKTIYYYLTIWENSVIYCVCEMCVNAGYLCFGDTECWVCSPDSWTFRIWAVPLSNLDMVLKFSQFSRSHTVYLQSIVTRLSEERPTVSNLFLVIAIKHSLYSSESSREQVSWIEFPSVVAPGLRMIIRSCLVDCVVNERFQLLVSPLNPVECNLRVSEPLNFHLSQIWP